MPTDEYSTPVSSGAGKLKLKGVKDAKVDKPKKKRKSKKADLKSTNATEEPSKKGAEEGNDKIVEDTQAVDDADGSAVGVKTEAEKRHEEMRRKRVRAPNDLRSARRHTNLGSMGHLSPWNGLTRSLLF